MAILEKCSDDVIQMANSDQKTWVYNFNDIFTRFLCRVFCFVVCTYVHVSCDYQCFDCIVGVLFCCMNHVTVFWLYVSRDCVLVVCIM